MCALDGGAGGGGDVAKLIKRLDIVYRLLLCSISPTAPPGGVQFDFD